MTEFSMSEHAAVRANQRGVTHQMISDVLTYADVEEPVGDGRTVVRLSRQTLRDQSVRSSLGPHADRLQSVALICSRDGEIVTVLHDHGARGGRRYRPAH